MNLHTYRVTKYDPRSRDRDGHFVGDEWTSVTDIGRTIGGKILSRSEYMRTEDTYVQAVLTLLAASKVGSMRVTDLEMRTLGEDKLIDDGVLDVCRNIQNNNLVSAKHMEGIIRGCLRGYIWCRLSGSRGAYLHFGYDYYMYIGLPRAANSGVLPVGIFLEDFRSPYMALD